MWSEYPYPIRRKGKDRVIREWFRNDGYVRCCLNNRKYLKHRIIAQQFIPNPDNLSQVDHINHNRTDNRLCNLRWVSASENVKNKSSNKGVVYEYFDEIPCESEDDIIEINDYGKHQFDDLYYCDNWFYFFNGIKYRRLHINFDKKGNAFVIASNLEEKQCRVYYSKFMRLYGLD